jgi:hypothetical protein
MGSRIRSKNSKEKFSELVFLAPKLSSAATAETHVHDVSDNIPSANISASRV